MKITRKRVIIGIVLFAAVVGGGLVWWWLGCPGLAHLVDRPPGNWADEDSCYQRLPEGVPKAVVTVKANDAATGEPIKEFFVWFGVRRHRSTLPAHSHSPSRHFGAVVRGVNGVARFEVPIFKGSSAIWNRIWYRGHVAVVARDYIPVITEDKRHPELDNTVINVKVKLKPLNLQTPDKDLMTATDACDDAQSRFCARSISALETFSPSPLTITDDAEKVKRLGIARCYIEALLTNWSIIHKDGRRFYYHWRKEASGPGHVKEYIVWRPGDAVPDSDADCNFESVEVSLKGEISIIKGLLEEITKPKAE